MSKMPTETKGYESLVSTEEYEAIKGVKEAFDRFIDIHNKNAIKVVLENKNDDNVYGHIQYTMLSDTVSEAQKYISMMNGIHTLDKDTLDDMCQKSECEDIEEYRAKIMDLSLKKRLLDML